MNILYLIETGGPGGAEQSFLRTLLEVRKRGHTCIAVTFREGWLTKKLDEHGVTRRIISGNISKLKCIKHLCDLIREYKIDILHSHLLDSNFYASIASFICGIPHVGTEHGDVHHSDKKRFLSLKTKITSLLTSRMISVSEFSKSALVSHGMSEKKISILGNPFNFDNQTENKSELGNYLGISSIQSSDWIWVHVANLRPVKDQSTLLKGFAGAKSRLSHPQHLLIAGGGELEHSLKEEAKKLGISSNVHFLGFRDDVETLLSYSNGFILSSLSEATPVSILEAAKYKLVLLASRVGGIPELITEGQTGYLYPPSSPESLSERIDLVISDKEQARLGAEKAHELLKSRFQVDYVTDQLLEMYRLLLSTLLHTT